jgi:hypothetical protein
MGCRSPLRPRARHGASAAHSWRVQRRPSGRWLRGLQDRQPGGRSECAAAPRPLPGARAAQAVRSLGRRRVPDRRGGPAPHRRSIRDRGRDPRPGRRRAPHRPQGPLGIAGRGVPRLARRCTRSRVGQIAGRREVGLLRPAMGRADPVPELRPDRDGHQPGPKRDPPADAEPQERALRRARRGRPRWARIASLIETAKMNGVEPFAWLTATLQAVAAGHSAHRIDELLPWNFKPPSS